MGCKCRLCYGAAEYFLEHQGRDYGLSRSPGHPKPVKVVKEPEAVVHLHPVRTAPQPWEPRPARRAA